jgi:hypothetical protein
VSLLMLLVLVVVLIRVRAFWRKRAASAPKDPR